MRWLRRILVVTAIVVVAYPGWLAYKVWDQSHNDEVRHADSIVVMGAAQYDGDPSPVFAARLRHAAYLFREGLAEQIIVAGGKLPGDRFSEAEAGARFLAERGVPEDAISAESTGNTTLESLEAVKSHAEEAGIDSVLLVSDPLHSERLKQIASDLGFEEAWTSPASYVELNRSRLTKAKELAHEVGSLLAYQLLERFSLDP